MKWRRTLRRRVRRRRRYLEKHPDPDHPTRAQLFEHNLRAMLG